MKPDVLPDYGIEVQMLDLGYREQYEKESGKKGDWFTTHGDIFPVGKSKLTPFPPCLRRTRAASHARSSAVASASGTTKTCARSTASYGLVNGEEVSGGSRAEQRTGYLCMESDGSLVEFKNIRIRELP